MSSSLFKRNISYIKIKATTEGCINPRIHRPQPVGCYLTLISYCNQKDATTPCRSGHNLMSAPNTLITSYCRKGCFTTLLVYQPQLNGCNNTLCKPQLALAPPCHLEVFSGHNLKVNPITYLAPHCHLDEPEDHVSKFLG